MSIRIYIQSDLLSDVQVVEVPMHSGHEDVKNACLAILPPEARGVELFFFEEDADSEFASTAAELQKPHGAHLHVHRCKHCHVSVRYNGKEVEHQFRPSATIKRVHDWAAQPLGLSPEDAAEHVLQITGTTYQPAPDRHLGEFATCPTCRVSFDLVPAHRING